MSVFDRFGVFPAVAALALAPALPEGLAQPAPAAGIGGTTVTVGAVSTDEERVACQFAIKAVNNIGEDVRILFSESVMVPGPALRNSDHFETMSDRWLSPGERLDVRYEVGGRCGASRNWYMVVRIGPRGGETIRIVRRTDDPSDRTIHLGEAACWATARTAPDLPHADRTVDSNDEAAGCDPETTRYGPVPAEETDDPAADRPAEEVDVDQLQGNWVRVESNNPRNDGMRIRVEGGRATITAMPPRGSGRFRVGQVVWDDLSADASLGVRGSDGASYPSLLTMEGTNRLHIDVDRENSPGNDQTWERAGPSIDGDWVLETSSDGEGEGLRIRVEGDQATLRYLPATASSRLRVGDILWRDIGQATLEALTPSRDYVSSGYRLAAGDRALVEVDGVDQVWVRPGAVGSDATACVSTGLVDDVMNVAWGWGLTDSDPDPSSIRSALPAWQDVNPSSRRIIDLDRSRVSGLDDHYALIWEANTGGLDWEEERGLTSGQFMERDGDFRNAGHRLTDIEIEVTPDGPRLSGIWTENVEGIDWDLDAALDGSVLEGVVERREAMGYRMVDIEAYPDGDETGFAVIWHRSCAGADWDSVADVDRGTYQDRLDAAIARGLQPIDIESWPTPAGQRYAAIFETPGADRNFAARSGRTLQWFTNYHRRYVDQGFRLIDYESYEMDDGPRYAGIWVENDARYRDPIRPVLDTLIQTFQDSTYVPGMSVVVIEDGDVVYRRGFGMADRDRQQEAWSGTVYLMASVSKVVGATLAARLEEKLGGFDLSRPTADYLGPAIDYIRDDVPSDAVCRDIDKLVGGEWEPWMCATLPDEHTHTVEQLLAKTACVPHYSDSDSQGNTIDYTPPERYYRWRAEALDEVWDNGLLPGCTPGDTYWYSSPGFTFVGAVLESQTGKDIATLIEDEISGPLGLSTLRAMSTENGLRPDYERAAPYKLNQPGRDANGNPDTLWVRADPVQNPTIDADYDDNSWKVLGGGLESSAMDLARFGFATLDGQVVSNPTRMWTSQTGSATTRSGASASDVGLAWNLNSQVVSHGGSWSGAAGQLYLATSDRISVAILANRRRSQMVRYGMNGHRIRTLGTLAGEIMNIVIRR